RSFDTVEGLGENSCCRCLPNASYTREEKGVSDPPVGYGIRERACDVLLSYQVLEGLRPVFACKHCVGHRVDTSIACGFVYLDDPWRAFNLRCISLAMTPPKESRAAESRDFASSRRPAAKRASTCMSSARGSNGLCE